MLLQSNVAPTVSSAFARALITQADVDAAMRPALRIRFRTGDFDPPSYVPYKQIQATETPWATAGGGGARAGRDAQDDRVAQERRRHAAARSHVVLDAIAVIGPRADSVVRDWYGGTPPYPP